MAIAKPKWTKAHLTAQFNRTKLNNWLELFKSMAAKYSWPTSYLLAISSRETNIRQIKGDFRDGIYHGYGLMQVDIKTDPNFCKNWKPEPVLPSLERGVQILSSKRAYLLQRGITDDRAFLASYNTGEGNVSKSHSRGLDYDRTTTSHDYGKDVLARARVFQELLEKDGEMI